jgi:hypothetical protein
MYKLIAAQLLHFSYNFTNYIPTICQQGSIFIKTRLLKTFQIKIIQF